jgi:hypothetical protein
MRERRRYVRQRSNPPAESRRSLSEPTYEISQHVVSSRHFTHPAYQGHFCRKPSRLIGRFHPHFSAHIVRESTSIPVSPSTAEAQVVLGMMTSRMSAMLAVERQRMQTEQADPWCTRRASEREDAWLIGRGTERCSMRRTPQERVRV